MARQDATEFGGGQDTGGLSRFPDGSSRELSASEEARVLRQMGMRPQVDTQSLTPSLRVNSVGQSYPEPSAVTEERSDLEERTNGYWREENPS